MIEFLALNGQRIEMSNDATLGHWFEAVNEGRMTEVELADAIYPYLSGV